MRFLLAFGLLLTACTGEDSTPIDLQNSGSVASTPEVSEVPIVDDPNAEVREQAKQLAAQQCLDDPTLEQGVIRIIDPDTDEMAGEVIADCEVVRAQEG
ncbi:MAG: hypothetical protein R2706_00970 [Acidimicrobiales bacterium]